MPQSWPERAQVIFMLFLQANSRSWAWGDCEEFRGWETQAPSRTCLAVLLGAAEGQEIRLSYIVLSETTFVSSSHPRPLLKETQVGVHKLMLEDEGKCLMALFCLVFQRTFEWWENLGHYFFWFIRQNHLEFAHVSRVENKRAKW